MSSRAPYKYFEWTKRQFVFRRNQILQAEEDLIVRPRSGLPEILNISTDGEYLIDNGKEKEPFVVVNYDDLPWTVDEDNNAKNYQVLENMLLNKAMKVIEIFSKSQGTENNLSEHLEYIVNRSKKSGVWSSEWEKDLDILFRMINQKRILYKKYACLPVNYLSKDTFDFIKNGMLSHNEMMSIIYAFFHGFWNINMFWASVNGGVIDNIGTVMPKILDRGSQPMISTGQKGIVCTRFLRIKGLGVRNSVPENGDANSDVKPKIMTLLNTRMWLSRLLPQLLDDDKDTIWLSTTYSGEKPSRYRRIDEALDDYGLGDLNRRYDKQLNLRKEGNDKNLLSSVELSYVKGIKNAGDYIHEWEDLRVPTSMILAIQGPNPERVEDLCRLVKTKLKNPPNDRNVWLLDVNKKVDTLKAIRSTLPAIVAEDFDESSPKTPFPLWITVNELTPEPVIIPDEKRYLIPLGLEVPFGNLYQWIYGIPFGIWAKQRTGKSTILKLYLLRADGILPTDSMFFVYNGENKLKTITPKPFGYSAISRFLNRGMEKDGLDILLKDGIIYSTGYSSPKKLRKDINELYKRGARMLIYEANEKHQADTEIDITFFETVQEIRSELSSKEIPMIFFVDEVSTIRGQVAELLFSSYLKDTTKTSEQFAITGHTKDYLGDYRDLAQASLDVSIMGASNLHRSLLTEADIDPTTNPRGAQILASRISEFSLRRDGRRLFAAVSAGGNLIDIFEPATFDPLYESLFHRKSLEARETLGE